MEKYRERVVGSGVWGPRAYVLWWKLTVDLFPQT